MLPEELVAIERAGRADDTKKSLKDKVSAAGKEFDPIPQQEAQKVQEAMQSTHALTLERTLLLLRALSFTNVNATSGNAKDRMSPSGFGQMSFPLWGVQNAVLNPLHRVLRLPKHRQESGGSGVCCPS